MISNIYNTESLKQEIDTLKDKNKELQTLIDESDVKLSDINDRLKKGQDYRDNLLKSKVNVDREIALLNPDNTKN